jgi:hypothetical protein
MPDLTVPPVFIYLFKPRQHRNGRAPTARQVLQFDLTLARVQMFLDTLSHILVLALPRGLGTALRARHGADVHGRGIDPRSPLDRPGLRALPEHPGASAREGARGRWRAFRRPCDTPRGGAVDPRPYPLWNTLLSHRRGVPEEYFCRQRGVCGPWVGGDVRLCSSPEEGHSPWTAEEPGRW